MMKAKYLQIIVQIVLITFKKVRKTHVTTQHRQFYHRILNILVHMVNFILNAKKLTKPFENESNDIPNFNIQL